MISILLTFAAFIWSAFCCVFALTVILLNRNAARWVLLRIGKELWSANMMRIIGNWRPQITFSSEDAKFDNWPKEAIFISNHASQLDINASASAIPYPIVYLAKNSIRKVPVLGLLNERVGTVFIDRSNPTAAKKSVDGLLQTLNRGISVIVYPEGTRSEDGSIRKFKKGAFHLAQKAQVPIIPLHIHGTRRALPKGSFRVRSNPVHVRFGKPIFPPLKDDASSLNGFVERGQYAVEQMRKWHLEHVDTPD